MKKKLKYELKDVLSEYNQDLYNEVSAQIKVNLVPGKGTWTSHIDRNSEEAVISYCKSEHKDAAFAHELLHIKAELAGLKDPYVRSNEPDVDWSLLRYFINHLAHHRIYPEFYDMGFGEDEFLHDHDFSETRFRIAKDVPMLEDIHKKLGTPLDGMAILMPYLVCISPNETHEDMTEFKRRLMAIARPDFIVEIDTIIQEWTTSGRMDYCLTLARLFKACGKTKISFAPDDDIENEISAATVN